MSAYCHRCLAPVDDPDASHCPDCGAYARGAGWPRDSRLGTVVAGGQFRVRRRLGRGGFGTVYLVETLVGGLRRALKVLHPELAADPAVCQRLVQEALVLEQVNHPNVARCYAVGRLDDQLGFYLLLELVEGQPLSTLLADPAGAPTPMDPLRAVRLVRQMASGLVAVHESGALHRDLKPQNILIARPGNPDEQVKLVDFGLARVFEDSQASTHQLVGTPAYMAPEQLHPDRTLDVRTDLWQLGAVLHTALTGVPPYQFESGGFLQMAREHAAHPDAGPRPSLHREDLAAHADLDAFVSRLLATDPARRPRSAAVVCAELARLDHQLTPQHTSGTVALLDALCATPGGGPWWSLCQYLDRAGDETLHLAHDAETRLTSWPDAVRRAPLRWWEEARRRPTSVWPLARALDLSGRGLTDAEIADLADNEALASLSSLELAGNAISDAGLTSLARSPHLRHLRRLGLSRNRLTSTAIEHLAETGLLERLEHLDVSGNGLGPRGADVIAARAGRLTHLDLSGNAVGAAGAAALAGSGALSGLQVLRLAGNGLGSDGTAELATSPTLAALTTLDIATNAIGPAGAAALAVSALAPRLHDLALDGNGLGSAALEVLLTAGRFSNLRTLSLAGNGIEATGAMLLASTTFARRLKVLDVSNNALGDAGLAALLGGQLLAGLWTLRTARNGITGAAVPLLANGPAELDSLDVSGNPLEDAGLRALVAILPRLRLTELSLAMVDATGAHLGQVVDACQGRLRALDVSDNHLGAGGTRPLAGAASGSQLGRLNLARTAIHGDDVILLARSGARPRLETLGLDGLHLGDTAGGLVVRALEVLPSLRDLSLSDNGLCPGSARALSRSALTHRLTRLTLSHNLLGDDGAVALARGTWHVLRELEIEENDVSLGGLTSLLTSPSMPLLWRVDAAHNVVTSALDLHVLPAHVVSTIESTFAAIAGEGADFASRFYAAFFRRHPGVEPLFRRSSMRRQHQHLMAVLSAIVDNLRHPDATSQRPWWRPPRTTHRRRG